MQQLCTYLGALALSVAITAAPIPAWADNAPKDQKPAAAKAEKAKRGQKDFVQVNINSADAKTLSKVLLRVGKKRAAAIVAYREEHGPFETAEDLAKVRGVSKRMVRINADRILLQDQQEQNARDTAKEK